MRLIRPALLISIALPLAMHAAPSVAQTMTDGPLTACPSQGELEQTLNSDGTIVPDACTTLEVNSLRSDNGELCLIDFSMDEGVIGTLRDAAFPSQWWVKCDELAARLPMQTN
ncbi:hypothetical protein [Devosia sp.]|uniref:hypothetical protein n=1 Tax=Devosia sp. TaxID=1871048 RepID=UPI003A90BF2B